MNSFKKDLACNITLICVLVFSAVHFILVTLNLFGAVNLHLRAGFNYILAYSLIVVCLALYVLGFFAVKLKNVNFPKWLRICFYVAFYIFTNVYYILGLHDNIFGLMVMFAYIAFLVNIVAVSVFYNVQKDDKYRLKTSKAFITTSIFLYSIGAMFVIELLSAAFKAFMPIDLKSASVSAVVVEIAVSLLVSIIMAIIFDQSLTKTKKFINGCLIKTRLKEPKPEKQNEPKETRPAEKIETKADQNTSVEETNPVQETPAAEENK